MLIRKMVKLAGIVKIMPIQLQYIYDIHKKYPMNSTNNNNKEISNRNKKKNIACTSISDARKLKIMYIKKAENEMHTHKN